MADQDIPSVSSRGLQFSWSAVFRLLSMLLPAVGIAVMLYLTSVFVTRTELSAAVNGVSTSVNNVSAAVAPIPARVQSLEEFRSRQERAQDRTNEKLEAIANSLAAANAIQQQQAETTKRILDQLERMNRRAQP